LAAFQGLNLRRQGLDLVNAEYQEPKIPPDERVNRTLEAAVKKNPDAVPCYVFNEDGLLIRGLGSLLPTELAKEYVRRIKKHNANKELV
jgi:hypothetical protein